MLKLDHNLFGNNFNPAIRTLIFRNCFAGDWIKTRDEFREDGIELTAARWMQLQTALISARNRLQKNDDSDTNCETIENFFMHLKKGSKKFRSILELGKKATADTLNLRNVTTFSNLANVELPPLTPLKKCLGLWNSNWMHNDMRNFLYLFRNNGLPLNNRINAFDPTVSPTCTFCRIIDRETETRDSFLHFFQDCPVTSRLLEHWCNVFEPPLRCNDPSFRNFYWYGYTEDEPDGSMSLAFVAYTFKYVL